MPDPSLDTGHLERPDAAEIYWERYGAEAGVPALFLHGGPGSGLGSHYRGFFDPALHTVYGMDQRGCGRSRPQVLDDLGSLRSNTTQHLIGDIEALRESHGVERWLVVGLSWGSTLALAYAEEHPDRVAGLVLGAVTTTSRDEVEWITEQLQRVFPREWARLHNVAEPEPGERVIDAIYRRLLSSDSAVRASAAQAWGEWEDAHVSLSSPPDPRWQDPFTRLTLATLVVHYWKHHAFLGDAGVLDRVARLAGIPAVLVHGSRDVSSGLSVPWQLASRWPAARLVVVEDGHFGPEMRRELERAILRLSRLLTTP